MHSDSESNMPEAPARPRRTRRRLAALVVAVALAIPATVLASHQFSDVPTSNPFHGAISTLVGSGITSGCGSGRYCPKDAVNREQMAAFMTRGGGRATADGGAVTFADAADFYVSTVSITAGGVGGGTGFIQVTADATAATDEAGVCPCEVVIYIVDTATDEIAGVHAFVISDVAHPTFGLRAAAGGVNWVFRVPSGASRTFGLAADVITTTAPSDPDSAFVMGSMSATYAPYGSTGGSTLDTGDGSMSSFFGRELQVREIRPSE